MRNFNTTDHFLSHVDKGLRTLLAKPNAKKSSSPADKVQSKPELSEPDKKLSARLMRVNHAGEIAAQGLYHGHMLMAKDESIKQKFNQSAQEEEAHLSWCEKRLDELQDRPSVFTPVWYLGSYAMGAAVGALGDKWSLGFVSETEKQVVKHLDKHLSRLPEDDIKSREVLLTMREEEAMHDKSAQAAGAYDLPQPAKTLMAAVSKVMTKTSYWI
ncbi:MAG: 2-polyprenyl-3-methyl-6-methoxy-1,4-benzoquinone monooxygenase [Gammaproteobacteria bacterium]|nr:MAG: 2-polyprenyl-3-methyl-6-methoxy-1,4-benzoquinone monooxygenase [Gammaproteobacteria bacterium]